MSARGALLAQVNPGAAIDWCVVAQGIEVEITRIVICNVTGGAVLASVHHDDTGAAGAGIANALVYQKSIPANTYEVIEAQSEGSGILLSSGGRLGVQPGTANGLTFSVYGVTARASEGYDG